MHRFSVALALALCLAPAAASGQQQCGQRAVIVADLARHYGERRVASGLDARGRLIEAFAAPDGASFTLLKTWPNGVACILSHGENWRPDALRSQPSPPSFPPDASDQGA